MMTSSQNPASRPAAAPAAQPALALVRDAKQANSQNQTSQIDPANMTRAEMAAHIERRLIDATWTLRRLPDGEHSWLHARQTLWPETVNEGRVSMPVPISSFMARVRTRPTPKQIDEMQPALDLLTMLPDLEDRRIVFWTVWHQSGEKLDRLPWARIGRSLTKDYSRWTLKRRYSNALEWLAAILL